MLSKRGFSLLELFIVMMIIGILTVTVFPTYTNIINQGSSKAALNNLVAIYNAQFNYFSNNNSYCTSTSPTNTTACPADAFCADSLPSIKCNLSVNILQNKNNLLNDGSFTYKCVTLGTLYKCKATSIPGGSGVTLTVTSNPIVLRGALTCPTGTEAACNPICTEPLGKNYCPS